MTKEDLYEVLCNILKLNEHYIRCQLDEFFSQNVCIPKGENRHKNADIWHEIVEGADFQTYRDSTDEWKDDEWISLVPVRIKPSEPIYEWQYLITTMFEAKDNKLSQYLTDDEANRMVRSRSEGWIKIEETKRIRT